MAQRVFLYYNFQCLIAFASSRQDERMRIMVQFLHAPVYTSRTGTDKKTSRKSQELNLVYKTKTDKLIKMTATKINLVLRTYDTADYGIGSVTFTRQKDEQLMHSTQYISAHNI